MQIFTMICFFLLSATTSLASQLHITPPSFDLTKANREFDRINLVLSVQNLNANSLSTSIDKLSNLIDAANQCVEDEQKKLNNIESFIKQNANPVDKKIEGVDLVYLDKQRKGIAVSQARCRLFSIRARESVEAYKTAITKLKQEEAFTRGLPLWTLFNQTIDSATLPKIVSNLGKKLSETLPSPLKGLLYFCIAFVSSSIMLRLVQKSPFARHHLRLNRTPLSHILLLTLLLLSTTRFFYLLLFTTDSSEGMEIPIAQAGLAFSSLILSCFLFKVNKVRAIFYWYALDVTFFNTTLIILSFFGTIIMIGRLFPDIFYSNAPLWQLCQAFFTLIMLATGTYFICRFCKLHRHFKLLKHHYRFLQRFTILLATTCAMIGLFGYHTLAKYLTFSGFATLAIIFVTLLITQSIHRLYLMLSHQKITKAKLVKYFGYRADQFFTEFLILKTTAQFIIFALSFYLIGEIWAFATAYIESLYDSFLNGVHFGNLVFYPIRIITGIIVFCLLHLIFRAISTGLSRQQQFENEEEKQVAIASIINYAGFGIAVLSGLLIAGFNFTGLAIIAGALSVGIGLGLQSIVNNFVCGIILLIEKPIRPGDRISIDGVEGFVKKIRVRSTQLITPAREDIIVPNSDLISRRVTNFMFSDKYCRINCDLNLAYGSDTNLVRDLLLNIANNHEEIIKGGRHKPEVLFRSFSESALVFQLSCLLRDVNKKSMVQSELNFAIDHAFRIHGIQLAYPQRDIHIKLADLAPVSRKLSDLSRMESIAD